MKGGSKLLRGVSHLCVVLWGDSYIESSLSGSREERGSRLLIQGEGEDKPLMGCGAGESGG